MIEEAKLILWTLNHSGGRLMGRLDRDVPFLLTNPDPQSRGTVGVTLAQELHDKGWIEIDESAPIGDIYTFQISAAGKAYLQYVLDQP